VVEKLQSFILQPHFLSCPRRPATYRNLMLRRRPTPRTQRTCLSSDKKQRSYVPFSLFGGPSELYISLITFSLDRHLRSLPGYKASSIRLTMLSLRLALSRSPSPFFPPKVRNYSLSTYCSSCETGRWPRTDKGELSQQMTASSHAPSRNSAGYLRWAVPRDPAYRKCLKPHELGRGL
jgi:hypothetical protein